MDGSFIPYRAKYRSHGSLGEGGKLFLFQGEERKLK
jgi:hypothetical protein